MVVFLDLLPMCMQVTDEIWNCDSIVILSWDTSTLTPFSLVLLIRVAMVLGFTGLVRLSPILLKVANSNRLPSDAIYSSLAQARADEPLVSQVNVTITPGHTGSSGRSLLSD